MDLRSHTRWHKTFEQPDPTSAAGIQRDTAYNLPTSLPQGVVAASIFDSFKRERDNFMEEKTNSGYISLNIRCGRASMGEKGLKGGIKI